MKFSGTEDYISTKELTIPVNAAITKGPFTISDTTQKVDFRLRGRQAKIRVSCGSQGTSWRYGSVRLALQPDGRR